MARYQEILLEDGTQVQLRLTTGKLEQYLGQVNGSNENPLLAVLDAMTILPKRIKLFTAALQWPENKNTTKTITSGIIQSDRKYSIFIGLSSLPGFWRMWQKEPLLPQK